MNAYDLVYTAAVALGSLYWLLWPPARRKVLGALRQRMGHVGERAGAKPAVMIHAVSLGEVNATRAMVGMLRQRRPDLDIIVSTTTQTGFDRATQLYAEQPGMRVVRYPLDFSAAVDRTLDALRPTLVVLMELEVWPNFVHGCARRRIPVVLANGRLTPHSYRGYKWIAPVVRSMFRQLRRVCVQDETYARRFQDLGVPPERMTVVGTMKFDTAQVADRVEEDEALATDLGLRRGLERVWVCGSTGPGEEQLILQEYRQLLPRFSRLRLVLVPRKPERFEEVARLVEQMRFRVLRRSKKQPPPLNPAVPPVILGDTMGELRTFYSLADVVFVGRSLVDLGASQHGSDLIEPAALGKPVIVGSYTANFAEAVRRFKEADAVLEVPDEEALGQAVGVLVSTPAESQAMGRRAQDVVRRQQGATQRHVEIIMKELDQATAQKKNQGHLARGS